MAKNLLKVLLTLTKLFPLTAASECSCLFQLNCFWQLWEQIKKIYAEAVGAKWLVLEVFTVKWHVIRYCCKVKEISAVFDGEIQKAQGIKEKLHIMIAMSNTQHLAKTLNYMALFMYIFILMYFTDNRSGFLTIQWWVTCYCC